MPYFKCNGCHHEWEGSQEEIKCDWCQSEGSILEEKTPLEMLCEGDTINNILEELTRGRQIR